MLQLRWNHHQADNCWKWPEMLALVVINFSQTWTLASRGTIFLNMHPTSDLTCSTKHRHEGKHWGDSCFWRSLLSCVRCVNLDATEKLCTSVVAVYSRVTSNSAPFASRAVAAQLEDAVISCFLFHSGHRRAHCNIYFLSLYIWFSIFIQHVKLKK